MRISDWSSYVCSSDLTAAYSQWNPYLPPQAQVSGTPRSPFRFHMVSADLFSQLLGVQLARLHTDKLPPKFNHSQTLLRQRMLQLLLSITHNLPPLSALLSILPQQNEQSPPPRPSRLRLPLPPQIGRASCRERVCQYVKISVVAVTLKKK